jgi:hypothetical protein
MVTRTVSGHKKSRQACAGGFLKDNRINYLILVSL